jgi:PPOX class probable F420-dependent enzyme
VLTTLMPDGMPQSSIVWVDYDGDHVLINTTLERQKGRNMQLNPKVTILVIDPNDSSRWVEVRGQVIEMTRDSADSHADKLTQRYCPGKQYFYRDIYPPEQKEKETRVIARIQPLKVSMDAIFR